MIITFPDRRDIEPYCIKNRYYGFIYKEEREFLLRLKINEDIFITDICNLCKYNSNYKRLKNDLVKEIYFQELSNFYDSLILKSFKDRKNFKIVENNELVKDKSEIKELKLINKFLLIKLVNFNQELISFKEYNYLLDITDIKCLGSFSTISLFELLIKISNKDIDFSSTFEISKSGKISTDYYACLDLCHYKSNYYNKLSDINYNLTKLLLELNKYITRNISITDINLIELLENSCIEYKKHLGCKNCKLIPNIKKDGEIKLEKYLDNSNFCYIANKIIDKGYLINKSKLLINYYYYNLKLKNYGIFFDTKEKNFKLFYKKKENFYLLLLGNIILKDKSICFGNNININLEESIELEEVFLIYINSIFTLERNIYPSLIKNKNYPLESLFLNSNLEIKTLEKKQEDSLFISNEYKELKDKEIILLGD